MIIVSLIVLYMLMNIVNVYLTFRWFRSINYFWFIIPLAIYNIICFPSTIIILIKFIISYDDNE